MLGMGDFSIFAAYALCILSAIACVVYGIVNWNKGGEPDSEVAEKWTATDKDVEKTLDI